MNYDSTLLQGRPSAAEVQTFLATSILASVSKRRSSTELDPVAHPEGCDEALAAPVQHLTGILTGFFSEDTLASGALDCPTAPSSGTSEAETALTTPPSWPGKIQS
jgi:hypothetical protein